MRKFLAALFLAASFASPALAQSLPNPLLRSSVYDVTYYGAKCDGKIVYGGISVSAGSKTVSTATYSFTSADVGAVIALSIEPWNGFQASAETAFNSTIASVSGGVATMASNSTFSSIGASARWYHTVDTTAIQAALTAGASAGSGLGVPGGAVVSFPPGVCVTAGPLTLYSNERIVGASQGATIVMLANGSNSDMFVGQNFGSLTGTNSTGGIKDFGFQNIQLDGNRGANTGTNIGGITGTGNAIRVYGYEFTFDNVLINSFAADGIYSEWSTSAGSPIDANGNFGPNGMEAHIHDLKCAYGAGWCINFNGPHDSLISHVTTLSMGTGGLLMYPASNGSPLSIDHYHGYQEPIDLDLGSNVSCSRCFAEGISILYGFGYSLLDSSFSTLNLGSNGGAAVYNISAVNTFFNTIANLSGSGFQDLYVNDVIGTVTGNAYPPSQVINTRGIASTLGTTFQIYNGSSWPAVFNQSSGSAFTITNNNAVQYTNQGNVNTFSGSVGGASFFSVARCASGGSPASCTSAPSGSVAIPTGSNPTLVVNTSAVTNNSQIILTVDETVGSSLSVTCNTTLSTLPNPVVTSRSSGVSFTIQMNATVATNPACVNYMIIN